MPDKYPYAYMHTNGDNACGGIAFYCRRIYQMDDIVKPSDFKLPDGTHPEPHTEIVCGSCRQPVSMLQPPTLARDYSHA